ncbi:MAG TPA: hypothetical protein VET90_02990 [Candidatus Binatus sp.]|nr:hypothetical protein [Candidatus Binatus sp.]
MVVGLVVLLVAACSSATTSPSSASLAPIETGAGGTNGPIDTGNGQPTFQAAQGHQPSGAKVRVFNAFSPVTNAPRAVDVYLDPTIDASSKPVATVPYGTLSAFFDPTQVDAAGDTSLTFLPAGLKDASKALITQPEMVKPGDVITILLTTGDQNPDGSYGGQTNVYFNAAAADSEIATPADGKGLLIVVSSGLDLTLSNPSAQDWYVSFGHGCEAGLGSDPSTIQTVSPGATGTPYQLTPGEVTVTIHGVSTGAPADCSTPPLVSAKLTAKAGVTDLLLLYGSDAGIRAEMIPLE